MQEGLACPFSSMASAIPGRIFLSMHVLTLSACCLNPAGALVIPPLRLASSFPYRIEKELGRLEIHLGG